MMNIFALTYSAILSSESQQLILKESEVEDMFFEIKAPTMKEYLADLKKPLFERKIDRYPMPKIPTYDNNLKPLVRINRFGYPILKHY